MFLKAVGQRSGEIVGESTDKEHANQIDVVDWTWGMTAPSAVGGTRTGRTLLGESSAVLSVRKAGGTALPYFVMKLNDARVNAFTVQSEISADGAPVLTEHLSLTYKSISIEYTVQTSKGGSQSTSSFVAETAPE